MSHTVQVADWDSSTREVKSDFAEIGGTFPTYEEAIEYAESFSPDSHLVAVFDGEHDSPRWTSF